MRSRYENIIHSETFNSHRYAVCTKKLLYTPETIVLVTFHYTDRHFGLRTSQYRF
jgi:hypothetical protein